MTLQPGTPIKVLPARHEDGTLARKEKQRLTGKSGRLADPVFFDTSGEFLNVDLDTGVRVTLPDYRVRVVRK